MVRFYFGLTEPNNFIAGMISEHLSDGATACHWLFEAGDVEMVTEELGLAREIHVKSSYSWSPLEYCGGTLRAFPSSLLWAKSSLFICAGSRTG